MPSCSGSDTNTDAGVSPDEAATLEAFRSDYAQVAYLEYEETLRVSKALQDAVLAFTASPSADTLEAAKKAWLTSRDPYIQTEIFRFYGGPIDADDGPESRINSWPLDEAYIDGVIGNESSGFINDTSVAIDKDSLGALNEVNGEANIATGYHAIEFILWGQDISDTGPGERPYTDFVDGADNTRSNSDRRTEFLVNTTALLVDDLTYLVDAWASDQKNYRADWETTDTQEILRRAFQGFADLSGIEMSGERILTALRTREQEDEHSCFSDNTNADVVNDALGIQAVYHGKFGSFAGTGLIEVIRLRDAKLADDLDQAIQDVVDAAKALEIPFDQAIQQSATQPGYLALSKVVDKLDIQTKLIIEAAALFDITINLA